MGKTLQPDRMQAAFAAIAAWRQTPGAAVACPACGVKGLAIVDRSARPHAEWYALSCQACGLDHTIHIALAAPIVIQD